MLIARKLLENLFDSLSTEAKEELYSLAISNMDAAMSRCAILYEEMYKDYPTGFVAALILQHLKDRVFQKTHKLAA
ncbi:MAG: hypothetical protein SFT81_01785 [Candidatus Caenarcaniphilales bacterium]|nr:hypothetical protein [Candidatus Caenarcaniphilales bacterium]